jgi:hypothetical protein
VRTLIFFWDLESGKDNSNHDQICGYLDTGRGFPARAFPSFLKMNKLEPAFGGDEGHINYINGDLANIVVLA